MRFFLYKDKVDKEAWKEYCEEAKLDPDLTEVISIVFEAEDLLAYKANGDTL